MCSVQTGAGAGIKGGQRVSNKKERVAQGWPKDVCALPGLDQRDCYSRRPVASGLGQKELLT